MRILITGGRGQLGKALMNLPEMAEHEAVAADVDTLDILDADRLFAAVDELRPDAILHCAAYTAVDKAEEDRDAAYAVNVTGTRNIAMAAQRVGARLVAVSTDYVFHGDGDDPLPVDAPKAPQTWYGQTKHLGEQEALQTCEKTFIVRTAWLFGDGNNFVRTMIRLGQTRDELTVVCDQHGSPTYATDLAAFMLALCRTERYGVYHFCNIGYTTWAEFATEIMRQAGLKTAIRPVTSAEYGSAAQRPHNSRLSLDGLDALGMPRPRSWQDALAAYLANGQK